MSDISDDASQPSAWPAFEAQAAGAGTTGHRDPSEDAASRGATADPARIFQSDAGPDSLVGSLSDVPLNIEAVIGGAKLSVADLLRIRQGDAVILDRRFGDPIELRLNGRTIGYGEIVADHDDNLIGIRMTRLTRVR